MWCAICRLTEEEWSRSTLSDEVKDILKLSKKLRDSRKRWKSGSHFNRNHNRNPSDKACEVCRDLPNSQKCVQYISVHEHNWKDLENKLIVLENEGTSSLVRPLLFGPTSGPNPPLQTFRIPTATQKNVCRWKAFIWITSDSTRISISAVVGSSST